LKIKNPRIKERILLEAQKKKREDRKSQKRKLGKKQEKVKTMKKELKAK